MDRVEYLLRLTHDHCDDGDEKARRQSQERLDHIQRGEQLLKLCEGMAELLRRDLRRWGWQEKQVVAQQDMPRVVRQGPREGTNG